MNENRENALDVDGVRIRADALISDRGRGWVPIAEWGPNCRGCGDNEFRIDGYCSCECRDFHSDDEAVAVARDLIEAARRVEELEQALRTSQAELVEEHHVREACEVQLADRDRRIAALREVFRDE